MVTTDQRCGTCRHWPARLDRRGRRIYAGDPILDCEAPIMAIDDLNLPASIVLRWPPPRMGMDMNDGMDCRRWIHWKDEPV